MLRRSKYLLTSKAKRLLYFSQIHSHLCYCLCVWGSMLQKHLVNKLEKAQCSAVMLINPNSSVDEIFRNCKILRFTDMVQFEQCKMGYKLCHNLLPAKLTQNMLLDHKSHSIVKEHRYPTRHKGVPNLPVVTNVKYRSSFLYRAIREYSALDNNLKQAENIQVFVKNCKTQLLATNTWKQTLSI